MLTSHPNEHKRVWMDYRRSINSGGHRVVNNTIICCDSFPQVTRGPNWEMKEHDMCDAERGMIHYFVVLKPTQMHIYINDNSTCFKQPVS